jgi:nitrogen regulatory protein PII
MMTVKRIEIIVAAPGLPGVLKMLDAARVSGYTIIKDATGKGERGERGGDELSGTFINSYVITTCPPQQIGQVIEALRPILKRFGGVCFVSDAEWVIY